MDTNKLLWQDKLDFAAKIVQKELEMISQFTSIINSIKYNNYPKERLEEMEQYKFCWANLNNLFDVLHEDYSEYLEDKETEKLKNIMSKYQNIDEKTDYVDLAEAKKFILKMMSKSGFHNLVRGTNEEQEFGEF